MLVINNVEFVGLDWTRMVTQQLAAYHGSGAPSAFCSLIAFQLLLIAAHFHATLHIVNVCFNV